MKRTVLTALVLLGLTLPATAAATPNVKYCGNSPSGVFSVSAGKNPPEYPRTSCKFAREAMKRFAIMVAKRGKVPETFKIVVDGKKLRGRYATAASFQLVHMRNKKHFVQLLAPY